MSDAPAETPAEVPAPGDGDTPTLAELDRKVDGMMETLKKILHPGEGEPTQATAEGETPDVASQVRAELAKVKQAEDRKAKADKDLDAKVDAKVKEHIPERPPKEFRRVTNLIWGPDE